VTGSLETKFRCERQLAWRNDILNDIQSESPQHHVTELNVNWAEARAEDIESEYKVD
jgi:hypothetical protein